MNLNLPKLRIGFAKLTRVVRAMGWAPLSLLLLVGAFIFAYFDVNAVYRAAQQSAVTSALEQRARDMERELKAETIWGDAFNATTDKPDISWLDDLYGSYLSYLWGYAAISIRNSNGDFVYSYGLPAVSVPAANEIATRLIASIAQDGSDSRVSVTRIGKDAQLSAYHRSVSDLAVLAGLPTLVVTETILPDELNNVPARQLLSPPMLTAFTTLDSDYIKKLGAIFGLPSLRWANEGERGIQEGCAFTLRNSLAQVVGTLAWRCELPASAIVVRMMPGILLAAIVLIMGIVGTARKIVREREHLKSEATQQGLVARRDALTGLPNRLGLTEHFAATNDYDFQKTVRAFILVDLDGFKQINDDLGHLIGDRVLCDVADKLRFLISDQYLARIGGDEFAVLVFAPDPHEVELVATKIVNALTNSRGVNLEIPTVGCSVGFSIDHGGDSSFETLFHKADLALYEAKALGRGRAVKYAPRADERQARKASIAGAIKRSLTNNTLAVHFEPLLRKSGTVPAAYRAHVTLPDPGLGTIESGELQTVGVECGLSTALDSISLRQAVREAQRLGAMPLVINISAPLFQTGAVVPFVKMLLDDSGFDATMLEIDVTTTVLAGKDPVSIAHLRELRSWGISVCLRIAGIESVTAKYLQEIDRLSLSKHLVELCGTSSAGEVMLAAVIRAAEMLEIPVAAEGVETLEQFRRLARAGCDRFDGPLFSSENKQPDTSARTAA